MILLSSLIRQGIRNIPVFVLLCLLPACGGQEQSSADAPLPAVQAEPSVFSPPKKTAASSRVTQKTLDVYQWYCTQCHGLEGKGDGINARLLTVPPRDHTKADYLETRSDRQLFDAIQLGGLAVGRAPCMPQWGHTLDDDTIRSLVAYIRELCRCEGL